MNLTIASSNLHHHNDSLDVYAFEEQLDRIAAMAATITFVQEVEQFTGYAGTRDNFTALAQGLSTRLGEPITLVSCSDDGAASGDLTHASQHFGALIRAGYGAQNVVRKAIYNNKAMLMFALPFGARTLNFVTMHLQNGQAYPKYGVYQSPAEGQRAAQWVDLNYQITLNFTNTSQPRFIVGDLNTLPWAPSLEFAQGTYYDLWQNAPAKTAPPSWTDTVAPNTAHTIADGETYVAGNPPSDSTDYERRIDYIFYGKKSWSGVMSWVKPLSIAVHDTRRPNGSMASDHFPILGAFEID